MVSSTIIRLTPCFKPALRQDLFCKGSSKQTCAWYACESVEWNACQDRDDCQSLLFSAYHSYHTSMCCTTQQLTCLQPMAKLEKMDRLPNLVVFITEYNSAYDHPSPLHAIGVCSPGQNCMVIHASVRTLPVRLLASRISCPMQWSWRTKQLTCLRYRLRRKFSRNTSACSTSAPSTAPVSIR